jgi:hypothetical protein
MVGLRRIWSDEEIEFLRNGLSAGNAVEAIATQLDRTPQAVKARAYALGLTLGRVGAKRRTLARYG